LRYAFADWGKIPLNPTLYAEYKIGNHAPNVAEFKLLLGEQIAPRIHWGLNFVYEKELRGERATEFQISQGLSYTLIDEKLSFGVEMKYVFETTAGTRGEPEQKFLIGPSLQVRPTRNTHLDLVALIGTNRDSPRVEGFVIFGIDFGKVGGDSQLLAFFNTKQLTIAAEPGKRDCSFPLFAQRCSCLVLVSAGFTSRNHRP
jgi:hypothetical protein